MQTSCVSSLMSSTAVSRAVFSSSATGSSQSELTLYSVLVSLATHAQSMASASRRRTASARDVFAALLYAGKRLHPTELDRYEKKSSEARTQESRQAWSRNAAKELKGKGKGPAWKEPTQHWLPSDEEEEVEDQISNKEKEGKRSQGVKREMTKTKRRRKVFYRPDIVPGHFPALPPKHTWLQTPAYAKPASSTRNPLEFLELKQASTMQTETSLRGLITSTEAARSLASKSFSSSSKAAAPGRSSAAPEGQAHSTSTEVAFRDVFEQGKAPVHAAEPVFQVQSQSQKTISPRSGTPVRGSGTDGAVSTVSSPEQVQQLPERTAETTPTQEERKAKIRMGRNLSLKLRTSSSDAAAPSTPGPPGPSTPIRASLSRARPNLMLKSAHSHLSHGHGHSLSFSGSSPMAASPQSTPPPFALNLQARRNTLASANWPQWPGSATGAAASGPSTPAPSGSSSFTWGFPPPPPSAMTPAAQGGPGSWDDFGRGGGLMTPLTPGAGFVYPPTPSDVHSNAPFGQQFQLQQQQQRRRYGSVIVPTAGSEAGTEGAGGDGVGAEFEIPLPGVVNYQRSHPRLRAA